MKRLADSTREPGYAMHVKGLELPAYLPETNPGYAWAIAGGHMSMGTFMNLVLTGDTSLETWVKSIAQRGYGTLRDDMTGLCKFSGSSQDMVLTAIKEATGIELTKEDLLGATRRAFLRGLVLERKQGYEDDEYTLPGQVFEDPNPKLKTAHFVTQEFFAELKKQIWAQLEPEMEAL